MAQITPEKAKEIMEAIAEVNKKVNNFEKRVSGFESSYKVLSVETEQSINNEFNQLKIEVGKIATMEKTVNDHVEKVNFVLWGDEDTEGIVQSVKSIIATIKTFLTSLKYAGRTLVTLMVLLIVVVFTTFYNNKFGYHERQTKDTVQVIHYVPYFTPKLDPEGENGDDK